jgi:acyl-coenzyme A synthetase/AMP-(fatty) acid ligase
MDLSLFRMGALTEVTTGRRMESTGWQTEVDRRARELEKLGVRSGRAVFLGRPNTLSFFVDLFATWKMGGVAVPLDPSWPENARRDLEVHLAPVVILDEQTRPGSRIPRRYSEGAALILLTSGSTGQPKAIVHSAEAIRKKMQALSRVISPAETARTFCALPTFFGHGLVCNSLFPLLNGADLFLASSFRPEVVMSLNDLINRHSISFLSTTPAIWSLIGQLSNNEPKPSLKRVHCASAPLNPQQLNQMRAWSGNAGLWNIYGLTEMLGWIGGVEISQAEEGGDVGFLWETEHRLDSSQEIHLRSSFQLMETLHMDNPSEIQKISPSDFIASGDLGEVTASGHLIVRGRKDFIINKGGLKVQPEEIERQAALSSEVAECCCYGADDPLWGQKAILAVVPRAGFDLVLFQTWLAKRLASYKVPDQVLVLKELPKTTRGKVDRAALKKMGEKI